MILGVPILKHFRVFIMHDLVKLQTISAYAHVQKLHWRVVISIFKRLISEFAFYLIHQ